MSITDLSKDSQFGTFELIIDQNIEEGLISISNDESSKLLSVDLKIDHVNDNDLSLETSNVSKDFSWYSLFWWLKFWNPSLSFRQLSIRDRESNFYAFDAMRAFAFFWVQLDHISEGMGILYSNFNSGSQYAVYKNGTNSPTVFFAISGFLNFYVLTRISEKYGEKVVSFKSIRNYIFRRYMHLAPNLYIMVALVTLLGYYTHNEYLRKEFYTSCRANWWTDIVFMVGDHSNPKALPCYNSTWSISVEFQFYLMSLPLVTMYGYSRVVSAAMIAILTWYSFHLRIDSAIKGNSTTTNLQSPYRFDAYGFGMLLYIAWDNILKPLKSRAYSSIPYSPPKPPTYLDYPKLYPFQILQVVNTYFHNLNLSLQYGISLYTYDWQYYIANYPNFGKILLLILWLFCIFASYVGLYDAFYAFPEWPWLNKDQSTNDWYTKGWTVMTYGLATTTIIALSIEGTLFPLSWFMNMFIWYPLGNITYTSYLLSIPSIFWIFTYLKDLHGGNTISGEVSYSLYYKYYWIITLINLLLGVTLSFVSERPFMNLSKAIEL